MKRMVWLFSLIMVVGIFGTAKAQSNKASYQKKYHDPALTELDDIREKNAALRDSITTDIHKLNAADKKNTEDERPVLRSNVDVVKKPKDIASFKPQYHFEPVAQYQSGMCWCFSATSLIESEIYRQTGQEIKLSELHTVYYEYLEKARRYIQQRGYSEFGEGSECNAVFRIIKQYGAVPAEIYTGLIQSDRHDHTKLFNEMECYLQYINDNNIWDEESALETIKVILNKYIGKPPQSFDYQGNTYSPGSFFKEVVKINLDDFVDLMSTMKIPFYSKGEFDVPDNWWHDASYHNAPLDEWYDALKNAIKNGYTLAIGGDVSEPGYNGFEDVAFVPDFDIPIDYINQDSREYRVYNGSTEDDHGIHVVGYTKYAGHDWFLIKDSGRGSRHGEFYGYYFYRGDYVRLKMLGFTVHKDAVQDILRKFN